MASRPLVEIVARRQPWLWWIRRDKCNLPDLGNYTVVWLDTWGSTLQAHTASIDLSGAALSGRLWSITLINGWATGGSSNYDATFTMTGLCTSDDIDIPGCTDPTACNYNPSATTDDGSCDFSVARLHQPRCMQLQPCGGHGRRVCEFASCAVARDFLMQFDPNATIDDGSCILPYDIVYEDLDGDGIGSEVGIADVVNLDQAQLETGTATTATTPCTPGPQAQERALTTTARAIDADGFQTSAPKTRTKRRTDFVADILSCLPTRMHADCDADLNGDGATNE